VGLLARKRLRRIPKSKRRDVTRGEFNALVDRLNERSQMIDDAHTAILKNLEIQFQRIATIQAELDSIRNAWNRSRSKHPAIRD
jgi:hypothetical protein